MGETLRAARKLKVSDAGLGANTLVAPSTVDALLKLVSVDLYTTKPPNMSPYYSAPLPQFYTAWHDGLLSAQVAAVGNDFASPPEFAPVATVEWDNTQLRWPQSGSAPASSWVQCAAGRSCAALNLPGAPGPLGAYCNPGATRSSKFCLLCIREDVEGLTLVESAKAPVAGRGPCLQAPFQNLVGCPGGYNIEACSVRPGKQHVFPGGVHIVGTSGALTVRFDTVSNCFFVDQTPLIYNQLTGKKTNASHFLGRGATNRTHLP